MLPCVSWPWSEKISSTTSNPVHVKTDEASAGRIRAVQLQAIFRFSPLTMFVNAGNASIVAYLVWPFTNPAAVVVWLGGLMVILLLGMRAWLHTRLRGKRETASARGIRRATLHAALIATFWTVVPVIWLPEVDLHAQLVLFTILTGMICAGAFALATVQCASLAYVVILACGNFIGLLRMEAAHEVVLSVLLVAYTTVVVRSAFSIAKLFESRFYAEAELAERGQVIELLLAEFEENGSDWLFELAVDLHIVRHSPRFAEVTKADARGILGSNLLNYCEYESRCNLSGAFAKGEPFRNLDVKVIVGGQFRWWSLTAKPMIGEKGNIVGWRGVGSDVTAERAAKDKIAWLARTDTLTGLANRSAFHKAVGEALSEARMEARSIAVGCIDLDQFKTVNDTYGHPGGDALLREVASSLKCFISEDIEIGRLGGDEFGILFRRIEDPENVQATAKQILAALCRPYSIAGVSIAIGASIGLVAGPLDGSDVDELVRNADLALYRAKDQGRGRVVSYTDVMRREAEDRRILQDELGHALAQNELVVYYQPIVDVARRRTVTFEALVRWNHPRRGLLSPDAFVSIAESCGLIDAVGEWVLAQACNDAACWPDGISVAVNLSPAQFGRANLMNAVVQALARSGLTPSRLELEITEALFLKHEVATTHFLDQMRTLGVRVALDDFGTGFSSLGYLARFPVHKIKIDRSFVSGSSAKEHRSAIIEAIVSMSRSLDIATTAEGVENQEMFEWIAQLGCSQAQGYYFARPMPACAIPEYFKAERAGRRNFVAAATVTTPDRKIAV